MTVKPFIVFCFDSSFISFLWCIVKPYVYALAANSNIGLPSASHLVVADTDKPRRIVGRHTSVLRVFLKRNLNKILYSIICANPVFVVKQCRPYPVSNEPRKLVSGVCQSKKLNVDIPIVQKTCRTTFFSVSPAINEVDEYARYRVVGDIFSKVINRFPFMATLSKAPARFSMPRNKCSGVRRIKFVSAITQAQPSIPARGFFLRLYCYESTKALACNIIKLRHRILQLVYGVRGRVLAHPSPSL